MDGAPFDFGAMTPEMREFILQNLPDLTGQEEAIMRQQAMANALRPQMTGRMDAASQAARALSGTYGGYQEGLAQQGRGELGGQYRSVAAKLAELMRKRRPNELTGSGQPVGGQAFFDPTGIDPNQFSWP